MDAAQRLKQRRVERRLQALAPEQSPLRSLARYASLAVRVDAPLLRRLRLDLLRAADAGIEADLWFSGLAESQGTDGFVFDAAVQSLLRDELTAETLPDGSRALDVVWAITERIHMRSPQSLRIEEHATWLALCGGPAAAADIEALLQPALKAMRDGEQRGIEIARWALRAMPRLPDLARHTDAALALAIGAVARLGASPRALGPEMPRGLPLDLHWLLPTSVLATRQQWLIEPYTDAFGLRAPRDGEHGGLRIELPRTQPLLLELDCAVGSTRTVQVVTVEPGRPVPLPEGWSELLLRTLAGDRYRVRRVGEGIPPTDGHSDQSSPESNVRYESRPGVEIPDNDPNGVRDSIQVVQDGALAALKVGVEIRHTYIGDLRVTLVAPSGREVLLHDRSGGGANDILRTFQASDTPALATLLDETIAGVWTVHVQDLATSDVGRFVHWSIEFTLTADQSRELSLGERAERAIVGAKSASADDGLAQARDLVVELCAARMFPLMTRLAEAILQRHPADARTRRLYAQGLIEQGNFLAAIDELKPLTARLSRSDPEYSEANGQLGRAYKQIFIEASDKTTAAARDALKQAIAVYRKPFEDNPANTWHGVNLVALLTRARRLGVPIAPDLQPDAVARRVIAQLDQVPLAQRDVWYLPTLAEASLGLGDWSAVEAALKGYVADERTAAFTIASTLRQFTQVWEVEAVDARGRALADILRAQLLAVGGGEINLAPQELQRARGRAKGEPPVGQLEAVLGFDGTNTWNWWRKGLERAAAVCSVRTRVGDRIGTGWLVRAGSLNREPADELLVVTNFHVVNAEGAHNGITPELAEVVFEAVDAGKAYAVQEIVWSSPPDRHDCSVLRLAEPVAGVQPLPLARALPLLDPPTHVYLIGHPGGRELAFSLQDYALLDHEGPPAGKPAIDGVCRVHYRAPTVGGSSGGPVFNAGLWEVIALHHAGGKQGMPRLNGQAGTYAANEGIWVQSIIAAMQPGPKAVGLTVTVSSTALDLPEHRVMVRDACLAKGYFPEMLESLPAQAIDAVPMSMALVDRADVYVCVLGQRYGTVPKGQTKSITELEFERALARGIEVLVFEIGPEHVLTADQVEKSQLGQRRLQKFKARARAGRLRGVFASPEQLKSQVMAALDNLTLRRGLGAAQGLNRPGNLGDSNS